MVLGVLYMGGWMVASKEMTPGDLMNYLLSIQGTQKALGISFPLAAQLNSLAFSTNGCAYLAGDEGEYQLEARL